jgi:16S rRNA (cytosine1402-N4)-methyltransferase
MLEEVLAYLNPRPGGRYVDATIDGGGHTAAILDRIGAGGRVLGIDRDPQLLAAPRAALAADVASGRLVLVAGNFHDLDRIVAAHRFGPVDGILFDLGLSSYHLDASGRGFSFMQSEALDMRFDASDASGPTAADLLRTLSVDELAAVFREFGEERFAGRIAGRIIIERERRPIVTTTHLTEIIAAALPGRVRWRSSRSAARVFQALRIAVNAELDAVRDALPQALALIVPGGRLVAIAFHSLEDRLVKRCFAAERLAGRVGVLTKRPLRPSAAEVAQNPRAASAKLRAAEKT